MNSLERKMALEAAVQSIKRDKMSYVAAAKLHGLVRTTVSRFLQRTDPNYVKSVKKFRPPDEFWINFRNFMKHSSVSCQMNFERSRNRHWPHSLRYILFLSIISVNSTPELQKVLFTISQTRGGIKPYKMDVWSVTICCITFKIQLYHIFLPKNVVLLNEQRNAITGRDRTSSSSTILFYNNYGTSPRYGLIISLLLFFFIATHLKSMSHRERQLALDAAVQSIKRDKMTFRAAAKLHGLAKSTVNRHFIKIYRSYVNVGAVNEYRPPKKK